MAGRFQIVIASAGAILLGLAGVFLGSSDPVSEARIHSPIPVPFASVSSSTLPAKSGARIRGHLGPGEISRFSISLPAGDYLFARVEQLGVDVAVSVADPEGHQILEIDSPTASQGSEPVPLVASVLGPHQITLRALDCETGGDYELQVVELHPATRRDQEHAEAAILLGEADRLRKKAQTESNDQAMGLYRRAIALQRSSGAVREEALALQRLSQVYLVRHQPGDALEALSQALPLVSRRDPHQEAGILTSMGQIWHRLDRREKARRAFEQAIRVAQKGRASIEEAAAWNNLANLQQQNGELEKALVGYDRALQGWRLNRRQRAEATALHNLGSLYLDLNRLPEARDTLLRSLEIQQTCKGASSQALTLAVLGQVQGWQGDHRNSLSYYRRAMALARSGRDRLAQAILLAKLGSAHLELGDVPQALALQEKAAALFQDLGEQDRLAWVLANLGWLHERQEQPERALVFYREAADLFGPLKDRVGEAGVLFREARIVRKMGDLEAARSNLEKALDLVESLRADAPGSSLRSSFLASRHTYYEDYVDLLMEIHGLHPGKGWDTLALEASERTRSRSFLDTLGEAQFDLREHMDRELLDRDRVLLSRLETLETERMYGSDLSGIETEERDILLERETLLARMHEQRSLPPPPLPLTAAQMQRQVLDPGSVLLVYSLGEKHSFLWLVDQHTVRSFVLPNRGQIELLAQAAWKMLSQGEGTNTQAKLVLNRLAGEILGPAAPFLNSSRLLIVPDGALQYVPFAVLPEPGRKALLLESHEIVYLDSPSVLAMQRKRMTGRLRAPLTMAVIADPVFQRTDPRFAKPGSGAPSILSADLLRSAEDLGVRGFGRLPESGREAANLLALVPRSQRLEAVGFAANRDAVLSGMLSRFRIVHFATHGVIHPHHPELSGLVLSLLDERGASLDGFLRTYEFQKLDLSADLVVLSACRTALGTEILGEGMQGMTRGFINVPRLVVSLWSVEDLSTAELMGRFYRGMFQTGRRPAAALREAQLSMLRETKWRDPRKWAPFFFQGEWR